MADNPDVVVLLKEYAHEASITRPEIAKLLGKRLGYVAGIHHRNLKTIGTWPKIHPERKKNRGCQFPVGTPGTDDFDVCGNPRTSQTSLVCEDHAGKIWKP